MASREEKGIRLNAILDEVATLTTAMEAEDGKDNTPENHEQLKALLVEGETIRKSIETDNTILGLKSFVTEPVNGSKAFGGGHAADPPPTNQRQKSLGEQFVESEGYKKSVESGSARLPAGYSDSFEAKGFLPDAVKATFNLTGTGLDSSRNYIPGVVMIEQQRLTVRDLLSTGETSQNIVYFIKESSFTNYADMVAEEGEKPEATLATTASSAAVKKIAVVLKVTEEMWNDFPMLRDYVNGRLTFMVQAKEEQQLINGAGTGNEITGILNVSGIQTLAVSGGVSVLDSIHKAMTKVRTAAASIGGYEPDGIIMHPTDYQVIRLNKDDANQYYGGGPFMGPYGDGDYQNLIGPWGLKPVVTTAITAGTALVGAFKLGAQIWQREGIRVESTNTNEDDFNFNRVSIRVEERLALTVYRPSAFCTVTSIA